jgi:DNA-binding MarR family transcriptional regulator
VSNQTIALQHLKAGVKTLVSTPMAEMTARQLALFLAIYASDGPHTVRSLSRETALQQPGVTKSLDRLEQLGLTIRRPDPTDRRSVVLAPTAKGRALYQLLAEGAVAPPSLGSARASRRRASATTAAS